MNRRMMDLDRCLHRHRTPDGYIFMWISSEVSQLQQQQQLLSGKLTAMIYECLFLKVNAERGSNINCLST